jgi:hypothetical protein
MISYTGGCPCRKDCILFTRQPIGKTRYSYANIINLTFSLKKGPTNDSILYISLFWMSLWIADRLCLGQSRSPRKGKLTIHTDFQGRRVSSQEYCYVLEAAGTESEKTYWDRLTTTTTSFLPCIETTTSWTKLASWIIWNKVSLYPSHSRSITFSAHMKMCLFV